MKNLIKITLLTSVVFISGCQLLESIIPSDNNTRFSLAVPVRPILPFVYESDLECLAPNVSADIIKRDVLRKHYSEELEKVIHTVNNHTN